MASPSEKQAVENIAASSTPDSNTIHDAESASQLPAEPKSEGGITKKDDVARAAYQDAQNVDISEAEFNRVRWKIDLHLMPLLMVTGFLQYFDRQSIQYAVLYGLRKDLHLVGQQYSWANSLFFFGTLVWQFPSLVMMQHFPVGKYFASQVFLWGLFSFCLATSKNFAGLGALRFLLGAAESVQLPAFAIITSMYYKRREQPFRLIFWYGMNGIAIIAGALFSYGVGHFHGIARWKYPFLISGALSTVWSVILWFVLPSNPSEAWFLTPEERLIAIARIHENQTGVESKVFKKEQFVEAITDPKIWINAISSGTGNLLGGMSAFTTLIVQGFGFTNLQTSLLQLPTGVIDLVSLTVFTALATYIPNSRLAFGGVAIIIALSGAIMLYVVGDSNRWAAMAGLWLIGGVVPSKFILTLGSMSANVAGHTKKITAQAIFFICFAVGNIVGPQLYTSPPYRNGLRANVIALSVVLGLTVAQIGYLVYENRKRRAYLEAHKDELVESDFAFRDLTDKQNPFCFNVY